MKKHKINKGFIVQKIDGKITIFDGERSQLITLNETATFIFERLKRGLKREAIVELVSKKYNTNPERVRKDFDELIKSLKEHKIIS